MPLCRGVVARLMWWRYRVLPHFNAVHFDRYALPDRSVFRGGRSIPAAIINFFGDEALLGAIPSPFRRRVEREFSESVNRCKDQPIQWASVTESLEPRNHREGGRSQALCRRAGAWGNSSVLQVLVGETDGYQALGRVCETLYDSHGTNMEPTPLSREHAASGPVFRRSHLYTHQHTHQQFLGPRLSPKWHVVPLYASNWVNPDLYSPVPFAIKDIDIVMLANFSATSVIFHYFVRCGICRRESRSY
jgi:hypothetical protein